MPAPATAARVDRLRARPPRALNIICAEGPGAYLAACLAIDAQKIVGSIPIGGFLAPADPAARLSRRDRGQLRGVRNLSVRLPGEGGGKNALGTAGGQAAHYVRHAYQSDRSCGLRRAGMVISFQP
jgi:hypothetical protein